MAKSKETVDFQIDDEAIEESKIESTVPTEPVLEVQHGTLKSAERTTDGLINCLKNKVITVHFVPQLGAISDKKHVLYGGKAERSVTTITVPRLRSGVFANVLTKAEKDFLEAALGLEAGAMNVYNKKDNFWDNTTEGGISKVRLTKFDTRLDLSDPVQYIQYKILLANTNIVAPDMFTLLDRPKATYQYVLISDDDINAKARNNMTMKQQCWMEYGKISDDKVTLRAILEILLSKPIAKTTSLEFIQTTIAETMESNPKAFLSVVKDPLLKTRILIKNCTEQGFISKKGDYYYLRSDNTPLCEGGEEPTLTVAARYLNNPKRQEMKLSLEALLK